MKSESSAFGGKKRLAGEARVQSSSEEWLYALATRIPKLPTMLEDDHFGSRMEHVLVRFCAIVGQRSSEWLRLVASIRDDELVHVALKTLVYGLDSTTSDSARRRRCTEILPSIRKRLSTSSALQTQNTVHLIMLLSYQELLVWNNAKAWMMHISGMSAIVHKLGPHAFKGHLGRRTLQQIRLFTVSAMRARSPDLCLRLTNTRQIPLNIFLRRTLFLEAPKWHKVPWSDGGTRDLLDHVLDTLTFFPGLFELTDRVRIDPSLEERLYDGVTRTVDALNKWRLEWLPKSMSPLLLEHSNLEDCVETLSNGSLVDPITARAVVLHLSTWLFLARLNVMYTAMLPWSVNYIVRSILRICEEYSYHQQGMGVLPWTTAIRVALFTDLGDNEELKSWCRDLCVRLETRYDVRLLSDIIAALPGPDEVLTFDDG
jgi:hypothetical protein